jgi:hypothetical protein
MFELFHIGSSMRHIDEREQQNVSANTPCTRSSVPVYQRSVILYTAEFWLYAYSPESQQSLGYVMESGLGIHPGH